MKDANSEPKRSIAHGRRRNSNRVDSHIINATVKADKDVLWLQNFFSG